MKRTYATRLLAVLLVLVLFMAMTAYAVDINPGQPMPQAEPQPVAITVPEAPQLPAQPIIPQTAPQPPPRDLTELFIAIMSLVSIILTVFAAPLIKAKVEESKLKKMLEVADTAVGAAWDMLKTQPGQERLQYALKVMQDYGYTANGSMIEDMLKSAWVRLKNELILSGTAPIVLTSTDSTADVEAIADELTKRMRPPDGGQGA